MKKILSILLIFALVVPTGCTRREPEPSIGMENRPGTEATVGTAPTVPTGAAETVPDPTGTEPEQPTVPVSAPVTTDPAKPQPTDPAPTDAPKPTDPAPKPTDPKPKPQPTEPTKPKPTEPVTTEAPKPKPTEPSHRHSYTAQVVAPTCTQQGYTLHRCSCGDSYTDSYTSATGHSYDGGKVTKAATCAAEGVKTYTCTKCGTTKTESIAKTAHSYVDTVVAPTYSAGGYTLHTCSVCDHSYTDSYTDQLVFDVNYWVEYAKNVAREMGFIVEEVPEGAGSEVPGGWGGWDDPDIANALYADRGYIEEYISQRLTRYKSRGIKYIWVWAEPNPYTDKRAGWYLYIGYA